MAYTTHAEAEADIQSRAPKAATEAVVAWTETSWPSRPSGYARVVWVGGSTRPSGMIAGDVWERDA